MNHQSVALTLAAQCRKGSAAQVWLPINVVLTLQQVVYGGTVPLGQGLHIGTAIPCLRRALFPALLYLSGCTNAPVPDARLFHDDDAPASSAKAVFHAWLPALSRFLLLCHHNLRVVVVDADTLGITVLRTRVGQDELPFLTVLLCYHAPFYRLVWVPSPRLSRSSVMAPTLVPALTGAEWVKLHRGLVSASSRLHSQTLVPSGPQVGASSLPQVGVSSGSQVGASSGPQVGVPSGPQVGASFSASVLKRVPTEVLEALASWHQAVQDVELHLHTLPDEHPHRIRQAHLFEGTSVGAYIPESDDSFATVVQQLHTCLRSWMDTQNSWEPPALQQPWPVLSPEARRQPASEAELRHQFNTWYTAQALAIQFAFQRGPLAVQWNRWKKSWAHQSEAQIRQSIQAFSDHVSGVGLLQLDPPVAEAVSLLAGAPLALPATRVQLVSSLLAINLTPVTSLWEALQWIGHRHAHMLPKHLSTEASFRAVVASHISGRSTTGRSHRVGIEAGDDPDAVPATEWVNAAAMALQLPIVLTRCDTMVDEHAVVAPDPSRRVLLPVRLPQLKRLTVKMTLHTPPAALASHAFIVHARAMLVAPRQRPKSGNNSTPVCIPVLLHDSAHWFVGEKTCIP